VTAPGSSTSFTDLGGAGAPKPGEGPSLEERENGFYDILFVGIAADGRKVRVSVKGDRDPGYGSTSKMMAETAIQLIRTPETLGGVWTPGAALGLPLVERLQARAGLAFTDETA
ncbi:MAG: saccharopine dehydrogenase, partial [Phenylobacterium sp.]|nr:saccharopine dehydrogenase [Phenylobacterium sp.]